VVPDFRPFSSTAQVIIESMAETVSLILPAILLVLVTKVTVDKPRTDSNITELSRFS
jgi:hypothetical protein